MSAVEWQHDSRRIVLPVSIFSAEAADITHVGALALLDTGASTSGITRSIAHRLGLLGIGRRPITSARQVHLVERYLFRIGVRPTDSDAILPFIFDTALGFELGDDIVAGGHRLDAVIGMDVLSQCDFSMDRGGRCRLAFG